VARSDAPASRSVRIQRILESEIFSGHLAPGARLDEVELAARFRVSRTPVREALRQLAAAGLAETRPHKGVVVAPVNPHRIYDMFEVMAELEGLAGSLAARRLDEKGREAITAAHRRCELSAGAGDSDAYYYDNEAFHKAIYAASRSDFLEEQCAQLHRRLRPYRRLQLRVRNRLSTSFAEHCAIVDAIFAGDGEEARRLLRAHVGIQGERFSDLVASMGAR